MVSKRLIRMACLAVPLAMGGAISFAQTAHQGSPGAAAGAGSGQSGGQPVPGWGSTPAAPPQAGQQAAPAAPQAARPTSPGGLVAVAPGAVVTTFYVVQPVDMTASNLMRTEVYNLQDERLGRIEDLVIGGGREIAAVVVGVGGFLGIGERYAALPPGAVVLTRTPDGRMRAVVDATRDQLRNSPEFKFEGNVGR